MDEQLLNEYINNLASQVNNLTQENILLKTRLSLLDKREQERLKNQKKDEEKKQDDWEEKPSFNPHSDYTTPPLQPKEPEDKEPKYVKAPKPKVWNNKVDGPRPLIPNPKVKEQKE